MKPKEVEKKFNLMKEVMSKYCSEVEGCEIPDEDKPLVKVRNK